MFIDVFLENIKFKTLRELLFISRKIGSRDEPGEVKNERSAPSGKEKVCEKREVFLEESEEMETEPSSSNFPFDN